GPRSTKIVQITPFQQGVAFFVTGDTTTLWISDGTRDGTRSVSTVANDTIVPTLTALDNKLVFVSGDVSDYPPPGGKIWASDGTAAGTRAIADFAPDEYVFDLQRDGAFRVDDRAVFSTHTCVWSTDGTPQGTYRVADQRPGGTWSYIIQTS